MPSPRLAVAAIVTAGLAVSAPAAAIATDADEPAPRAQSAAAKPRITLSGSTSILPLARQLLTKYGKVRYKLTPGGSDIGLKDVAGGKVNIGNVSRDPMQGDPSGLAFNRIARDGVCLITNKANPIKDLSQQQVQDIFSGKVTSWSEVPGAGVSGPIELVVRDQASGTQDAFQNIFMGPSLRVTTSADQKSSNGLVQQSIASGQGQNRIGYVDFRFTGGANSVAYRGTACTLQNARSGTYRGLRNFWMVTKGPAKGATASFLKWIRTSPQARAIISSNWVPTK